MMYLLDERVCAEGFGWQDVVVISVVTHDVPQV